MEEAGARLFHLDVMDGQFVPNLSFGIPVVEAVRRITQLPLDVHLMIVRPERYLKAFRNAGADMLTIHVEAVEDPGPQFDAIRRLGAVPGIAYNPPTSVERILPWLNQVGLVLTMSVMPGFGGQQFDRTVLEKLSRLRDKAPPNTILSVDGGVNRETITACRQAGANMFVVGSALFGHGGYRQRFEELSALARQPASTVSMKA